MKILIISTMLPAAGALHKRWWLLEGYLICSLPTCPAFGSYPRRVYFGSLYFLITLVETAPKFAAHCFEPKWQVCKIKIARDLWNPTLKRSTAPAGALLLKCRGDQWITKSLQGYQEISGPSTKNPYRYEVFHHICMYSRDIASQCTFCEKAASLNKEMCQKTEVWWPNWHRIAFF